MPWSASEASKFKKGLSRPQKEEWSKVANAVLKRPGYDESSAIRIASSKVKPAAVKRRLKRGS